jgi:hypothetical protein
VAGLPLDGKVASGERISPGSTKKREAAEFFAGEAGDRLGTKALQRAGRRTLERD